MISQYNLLKTTADTIIIIIIIMTMGSYNARHIYSIEYSSRRCGATAALIRQPQTHPHNEKPELDDSRTSMPALAHPCTSGVETSKHMQVTCWHCGCWDHYECVDNQYLSPYRTGGKWLPWFLRKSRPFIFKYRPLGPTYFNI